MKASEHLSRILEKVKATHWGQGSFVVEKGKHPKLCLLGLTYWTSDDEVTLDEEDWPDLEFEAYGAVQYLSKVIDDEPLPEGMLEACDDPNCIYHTDATWGEDIADFNDYPETTRDDIIRVVEKAMALAQTSGD